MDESKIRKEIAKAHWVTICAAVGVLFISGLMLWFGLRGSMFDLATGRIDYEQYDKLVNLLRLLLRGVIPLIAVGLAFFALMVLYGIWQRHVLEKQRQAVAAGVEPDPRLDALLKSMKRVCYVVLFGAIGAAIYFNSNINPPARPADAILRQKLVGKWDRVGVGMASFAADGTYSSGWTNLHVKPTKVWMYGGTWEITNGACVMTTKTTNGLNVTNLQAIGTREQWKVVQLDETKLIMESGEQRTALTRKN